MGWHRSVVNEDGGLAKGRIVRRIGWHRGVAREEGGLTKGFG